VSVVAPASVLTVMTLMLMTMMMSKMMILILVVVAVVMLMTRLVPTLNLSPLMMRLEATMMTTTRTDRESWTLSPRY
jgi:hypothetical protein